LHGKVLAVFLLEPAIGTALATEGIEIVSPELRRREFAQKSTAYIDSQIFRLFELELVSDTHSQSLMVY
jgi:hypothetical protein